MFLYLFVLTWHATTSKYFNGTHFIGGLVIRNAYSRPIRWNKILCTIRLQWIMLSIVNAYGCVLDIVRVKLRINDINKPQLTITPKTYYPNQWFFMQTGNDINNKMGKLISYEWFREYISLPNCCTKMGFRNMIDNTNHMLK